MLHLVDQLRRHSRTQWTVRFVQSKTLIDEVCGRAAGALFDVVLAEVGAVSVVVAAVMLVRGM